MHGAPEDVTAELVGQSSDHQLGCLLDSGELGERLGNTVTDDLAVDAAKTDEQAALALEIEAG